MGLPVLTHLIPVARGKLTGSGIGYQALSRQTILKILAAFSDGTVARKLADSRSIAQAGERTRPIFTNPVRQPRAGNGPSASDGPSAGRTQTAPPAEIGTRRRKRGNAWTAPANALADVRSLTNPVADSRSRGWKLGRPVGDRWPRAAW
jgi:hypothetical protein